MAKKKKNSKKKGPKVEKILDQKIQEQAAEVTEAEAVEAIEEAEVQAPAEVTVQAPVEAVVIPESVAEEPIPVEAAAVTEPAAEDTAPVEASAVTEAAAEEVTDFVLVDEPVAEVTDDTVVLDPVAEVAEVTDDTVVLEPFVPADRIEPAPAPAAEAIHAKPEPAEPAGKIIEEPVRTTALAPVIPAAAESEKAEAEKQAKKAQARENRARFLNKTVSRKMLAAALAAALVLNGAITAGIMALYTKSIKGDISEVNKLVSELDKGDQSGDDYGSGFLPPDWNSGDNGWNDDWYGNDQNDNGWYNDDRDDDDWEDDWYGSPEQEQPDNQYGQQGSSGTSIGIVISDNDGVIITQVTGSNAQKAGFETGDKIISFDGKSVSDSNSLISEVQKHNSGDKVTVVVERNGNNVTINTELE